MKKYLAFIIIIISSCNTQPGLKSKQENVSSPVEQAVSDNYTFRLALADCAVYKYDITSGLEIMMEMNGNETDNTSRTEAAGGQDKSLRLDHFFSAGF